jgi:putative YphP/YqiW family bacilliredoxin
MSLEGGKTRPFNHCFAGVDKDALMLQDNTFPFSSIIISMALFKNELVHMLERHHIEGRPAELIA